MSLKVGDRLRYVFANPISDFPKGRSGKAGTVSGVDGGFFNMTWDDGVPDQKTWSVWRCDDPLYWERAEFWETTAAVPPQFAESTCRICSRKNDVGVSKCWHCECADPCPAAT